MIKEKERSRNGMDINILKQKKEEQGLSIAKLSGLSGVPEGTIAKILSGETRLPRFDTIRALERVLGPLSATYTVDAPGETLSLAEKPTVYGTGAYILDTPKRQGEYTIEDYYTLPDEKRVELIDGVIYDMTAPVAIHQFIAGELYYQLVDYVKKNKGNCIPFIAPFDVQLKCDNKTMVQPDVGVLCSKDKLTEKNIYGAPDFVAEILSPGTRKKDMYIKLNAYLCAGVREYWIIDPALQTVHVHYFEDDTFPRQYAFTDSIPVNIYEGALAINLSELQKYM